MMKKRINNDLNTDKSTHICDLGVRLSMDNKR
jgi:hypothetical protein